MPSNPGIALWLFHLRVGARLALRSSALLFSALLAAVMFDMYPAAVVQGLALGLFGARPDAGEQMMVACLALLLALWAAPRVTEGLRGWIRHLPASRATMRRAVAAALVVVEVPLALSLALLAGVARARAAAAVGQVLHLPERQSGGGGSGARGRARFDGARPARGPPGPVRRPRH